MKSPLRRLLIAVVAVGIAAIAMRAQIADALIVRGDDLLVRDDYNAASRHYERALWLDPESESAVDRLAFLAIERHNRSGLAGAVHVATTFLERHRTDAAILFDRGLCYLRLKNYAAALVDFRQSSQLTGDPQQYVFAGWAAERSGRVSVALQLWRTALVLRKRYRPALDALRQAR